MKHGCWLCAAMLAMAAAPIGSAAAQAPGQGHPQTPSQARPGCAQPAAAGLAPAGLRACLPAAPVSPPAPVRDFAEAPPPADLYKPQAAVQRLADAPPSFEFAPVGLPLSFGPEDPAAASGRCHDAYGKALRASRKGAGDQRKQFNRMRDACEGSAQFQPRLAPGA